MISMNYEKERLIKSYFIIQILHSFNWQKSNSLCQTEMQHFMLD